MEIRVEFGNAEQKDMIRQELSNIERVAEIYPLQKPINLLIVPEDFSRTVNLLQGTDGYTSTAGRRYHAMAKIVSMDDSNAIVFSRDLYTESFDAHIRLHLYFHEFIHVVNEERFVTEDTDSQSTFRKISSIYTFFDEYVANRKAFELTDLIIAEKSLYYRRLVRKNIKSFITDLINEATYYKKIKWQIFLFRWHGDIIKFLERIDRYFDEVTKIISYTYSYIDHFPKLNRLEPLLNKSKFINERTFALINFVRNKYLNEDYNLLDGLELIDSYMANFGLKFEDMPDGGEYCRVLNI